MNNNKSIISNDIFQQEGTYEIHKHLWFIKWYEGQAVVTLHDFEILTGINLSKKKFFKLENFKAGTDWNVFTQK